MCMYASDKFNCDDVVIVFKLFYVCCLQARKAICMSQRTEDFAERKGEERETSQGQILYRI